MDSCRGSKGLIVGDGSHGKHWAPVAQSSSKPSALSFELCFFPELLAELLCLSFTICKVRIMLQEHDEKQFVSAFWDSEQEMYHQSAHVYKKFPKCNIIAFVISKM